jgi:crotonobetainyl-CoA:carnitine CoA-transferase CaiB-like acyl-CoA transferase
MIEQERERDAQVGVLSESPGESLSAAVVQPGRALADVRVVEFAIYAAGPGVGKHLAACGAEVIHVESAANLDGFRTHYPPFVGGQPGPDRSGCHAIFNDGKYSATLNLKHPRGRELAMQLVARADVVIENFTPGTIERLGLGYEAIAAVKPEIILLSSCNMGQTGPGARHPGFGTQLTSMAGFTSLTGYRGGPPMLNYGPYIDFIAVGYGVVALLAALDHRDRTGKGQHIDLSQYEAGLQFIAPTLLDYQVNAHIQGRDGNHSARAVPHGVYPCAGEDEWCTISVCSDEEWQRLVAAMDAPEWATDGELATILGRHAREADVEEHLGEWTRGQPARMVASRLQAAGVKAAVVASIPGVLDDPQLAHRRFWQPQEHRVLGAFPYETAGYLLSQTPSEVERPSPCLGEHNEYVFKELLGLPNDEYVALVADRTIF